MTDKNLKHIADTFFEAQKNGKEIINELNNMTENQKYRLNSLMRKIIKDNYEGNSSALAREISVAKQTIYKYFHNKKQLSWNLFNKIAEKSDYKIKINIEKILSE